MLCYYHSEVFQMIKQVIGKINLHYFPKEVYFPKSYDITGLSIEKRGIR